MENNKRMQVVPEERFGTMLEDFLSSPQIQPLVIFYNRYYLNPYLRLVEKTSNTVFGDGKIKVFSLENMTNGDMTHQIAMLSELPHKMIELRTPPICSGYDEEILFAEKLAKASKKHVVLMIPETNDIAEESMGSRILYYYDHAAMAFQAWSERALVWVADCPKTYARTRQVYLSCQSHGVLDMLKAWSEEGKADAILKAVSDSTFLNETYTQYVATQTDLPSVLKCSEFNERLIKEEMETEYGTILTIKAESLENTEGKEQRIIMARWRRATTELKLTLPSSL